MSRHEPSGSNQDGPQVTVGVPVFNGEMYLDETLQALEDQELDEIEVIVADNASTDGTLRIAERFARRDPRFRILRSDRNRGVPWNWNRVLDEARAPLFMWNGADDVARPAHLASCRNALAEHPDATIAFSRVELIDTKSRIVGQMDDEDLDFYELGPADRVEEFFRRHAYQVIGFGGVHRTDVLREMGGLPEYYGGDMALAVRMAMRAPWIQVPEHHFRSRRHDAQTNKVQGGDVIRQVQTYDPTFSRPVAFPQWYLNAQLLRQAFGAPVPLPERIEATGHVLRLWTAANWRFLPFDIKRNLIRLMRGEYRGAYHSR